MHIAMIQDDWWPRTGGGPVHVRELAISLAEQYGHNIDIYTRALRQNGQSYTDSETYADGRVSVIRLNPCTEYWNGLGRVSSLITPLPALLAKDYDIIHGHSFLPAVPTRFGGMLTDAATVFTVHGTAITSGVGHDTSLLADLKLQIERQFVLEFDYDHVISVNTEHLDLLAGYHSNLSSVPNGVDLDRFAVATEPKDEILFLGRLAPKKRVEDLIDAFALIAEDFPEMELVIVGTGPLEEKLKDQAAQYDVENRIRFEGRVSNDAIPKYYRQARLFVLPSVWEGHPLTLLEAWAAELPVITSNVEGIAEFVEHEKTGYLVPPKSPKDLAEGLQYVLSHPEVASEWSTNAYELAQLEYSWDGVANQTNKIYEQIIE